VYGRTAAELTAADFVKHPEDRYTEREGRINDCNGDLCVVVRSMFRRRQRRILLFYVTLKSSAGSRRSTAVQRRDVTLLTAAAATYRQSQFHVQWTLAMLLNSVATNGLIASTERNLAIINTQLQLMVCSTQLTVICAGYNIFLYFILG